MRRDRTCMRREVTFKRCGRDECDARWHSSRRWSDEGVIAASNRLRACIEGFHAAVWMSRRLISVEGEGVVTATLPPATLHVPH